MYTFRLIFLVFLGPLRTPVTKKPGYAMQIPVWILAFLSIVGGFDKGTFRWFMASVFPGFQETPETASSIAAALAFLAGVYGAWFYVRRPVAAPNTLERLWFAGWGFDWIYDRLFVRPILWAARVNRTDIVDSLYDGIAALTKAGYGALTLTETGKVRWYAAAIAGGSVLFVALVMFL